MRYRPLGVSGTAVSAITLVLDADLAAHNAEVIRSIVFASLEQGINAFHIDSLDRTLIRTAGEALSHVERDLLYVSLTIGPLPNGRRDFTPEGVDAVLTAVLKASNLQYVDAIILDDPAQNELPTSSVKAIRADERIRSLGVRGDSEVMQIYVNSSLFDVLHAPCHIQLNAKQRNRLREARESQMTVFGVNYYPENLLKAPPPAPASPQERGLFGIRKKSAPVEKPTSPFDFLDNIPGWEAEDICLAHALLDTGLTGILVHATAIDRLERLAAACERDMPVSMPAQLEMARVGKSRPS